MNLKFIHITKTAGTSIENVGYKNNIMWGRYDKDLKFLGKPGKPFWHTPFQFCDNKEKKKDILDKYNLFTVVRNPYDRCISEYFCKWGGPRSNLKRIGQLNSYIQHRLSFKDDIKNAFPSNHFTPQYLYVYDDGKKHVKHILKLEDLETDFSKLMNEYNINITLDRFDNKSIKNQSVSDLNRTTIKMIREVYSKDFDEFDYER